MSAAPSLIPELEDVIQNGSQEKRAETVKRIAGLFVDGADHFTEAHVGLFDDVLGRLIVEIEAKTRMELAIRLAPIANAPLELMRGFAKDDEIAIAAPVLRRSPRLSDDDLVDIAKSKGQAHLLAISGRAEIATVVTDVLVRRGDRDVVRTVAENPKASLSNDSFATLVKRAETDSILAEKVGLRADIPAHLFRDLLVQATEVVQRRLMAAADGETQAEIRRVLDKVSGEVRSKASLRDFRAAQHAVLTLQKAGRLGEPELLEFARSGMYEEAVCALAMLCAVPIDVIERLMSGERSDPILILCRARGFGWPMARALMLARPGGRGTSTQALDTAYGHFERLSASTAQRVLRFWQLRPGAA